MSDKETAPWIKKVAKELCGDDERIYIKGGLSKTGWPHGDRGWANADELAKIITTHCPVAGECTAPAPQPDAEKIRLLLIRAVMEMSYMHCAEVLSLVRSSEGESIIEEGMKILGLKDLSEEELARVRAATPQATPWKSHFTDSDVTGDIHNYVDTGDGKRLWAQDADEIVKRHNEQALQVTPELELEQEVDGRWLAEYMRFPGVAAYGPTREEAIRNAAKVLIESEPASPMPDSSAATQKEK